MGALVLHRDCGSTRCTVHRVEPVAEHLTPELNSRIISVAEEPVELVVLRDSSHDLWFLDGGGRARVDFSAEGTTVLVTAALVADGAAPPRGWTLTAIFGLLAVTTLLFFSSRTFRGRRRWLGGARSGQVESDGTTVRLDGGDLPSSST